MTGEEVTELDESKADDAGEDFEACRLIKNNANYRVQLDGTGSFDNDSEISYQWKAADANGNPYTCLLYTSDAADE